MLKKKITKGASAIIDDDDDDEKIEDHVDGHHEEKTEPTNVTEYLISAVIKKKLLFNKRPRPIVYLEQKQI